MTPRVELIYDGDCPNVGRARAALREAFREAGDRPSWTEWDRKAPDSPAYARRYGSPTILVDGRDVAGAQPLEGSDSCRIYGHPTGGLDGVPPVGVIASALRNGAGTGAVPPVRSLASALWSAAGSDGAPPVAAIASVAGTTGASASAPAGESRGWWRFLASLPGAGAALLPVGVCPACWPAYAGLLGSLGLGFLLETAYLLPVTVGLLGLALLALGFRARARRGRHPLALGIASAGGMVLFKFAYPFDPLVYAGLLGLVAATVWNAWPKRKGEAAPCPRCVRQEPAIETRAHQEGGAFMATKRTVEIFSAGCPACEQTVELVNRIACPSCEVTVLDMNDPAVAGRAKKLGVRSVPAVAIDGRLADCCSGIGPDEAALRAAGVGRAV